MDLFDTEAFHLTPAFSEVQPPQSQMKSEGWIAKRLPGIRPRTFQVPHELEVKKLTCTAALSRILSPMILKTFQVSIDTPANEASLDFFSKPHTRNEVLELTEKLRVHEQERVKQLKLDADPYSSTRKSDKYANPDAVLMASLKVLYKELITENFALASYDFVTIGDTGGVCEFVVKDYKASNTGEVRGWSVFPKLDFKQDSVEVLAGPVSFAELEGHIAHISSITGSPTCMLVVGNLPYQGGLQPHVKEKRAKLQLSMYMFSALRLLTKGGALVFKCHNTWLPATCELLYCISRAFTHFSIVKPYCSPSHSFVRVTSDSLCHM
jgi:hypothetical protein